MTRNAADCNEGYCISQNRQSARCQQRGRERAIIAVAAVEMSTGIKLHSIRDRSGLGHSDSEGSGDRGGSLSFKFSLGDSELGDEKAGSGTRGSIRRPTWT
jgi:hypothetical protein